MTTKLINKKMAVGVLALLAAALMAQAAPPVFNLIGSSEGFVAIDSNGIVYVADSLANEVVSYTPPASPGGSWTQTVLYQFAGGAFSAQLGQLVVGPSTASGQPVLYGVTNAAGSANLGTIYSLTPPGSPDGVWTEAVLYNFTGAADSSYPIALARAANGTLFGVTAGAYNSTNSTVFMLGPPSQPAGSWTHSVIYAANYYILLGTFQGLTIGSAPKGSHGLPILYGYGDTGSGAVFSLTPPTTTGGSWTEVDLNTSIGAATGSLTAGPDGTLYGTTWEGGNQDGGTVFSLTPPASPGAAWTETTLYNFSAGPGGTEPLSGVVMSPRGVLYGTTYDTTTGYGWGTIFSLSPPKAAGEPWTKHNLYQFSSMVGGNPRTPMVLYGGVLYGTTSRDGGLFSLVP
jgi:uncharacterized repeat protein (TIGR03803 family)